MTDIDPLVTDRAVFPHHRERGIAARVAAENAAAQAEAEPECEFDAARISERLRCACGGTCADTIAREEGR